MTQTSNGEHSVVSAFDVLKNRKPAQVKSTVRYRAAVNALLSAFEANEIK